MSTAVIPARGLNRRLPRLRLPGLGLESMRNWRLLPKLVLVMTLLALTPLALVIGLN